MLKHTMTATALAVLLATPAFAQQPTSNPKQDKMQTAQPPQGAMPKPMSKDTTSQDTGSMNKGNMAEQDANTQPAGFMHSQSANEWRASKLIGASVYGPDDKSIGDVNDVLIAKDGRVTAVVVGVGGFLGVGEKNVALPLQALDVQRDNGAIKKITEKYSKKQIKDAPTFAYYKAGATETTGESDGGKPGSMNK